MSTLAESITDDSLMHAGALPAERSLEVPIFEAHSDLVDTDEFQLSRTFDEAYALHRHFSQNENAETLEQTSVDKLLKQLKAIAWHVDKLSLFSINEELDDINTADLKFLLVPFLLAETSNMKQGFEGRAESVRHALVYWCMFSDTCQRLDIAHKDDVKTLEREETQSLTAAENRDEKIARYRRSKELNEKVEWFFRRKKRATGDAFKWGCSSEFDESMERDLILALLSQAVSSTANNVPLAKYELKMLEEMERRGGPSKHPPPPPKEPVEKPWVVRIQDKSELYKLYKDQVFQPHIPLPTMTLAELADREMAEVQERETRTRVVKQFSEAEARERYYNGDRDGTRENDEDEEKAVKDRNWDDWKDEHPKGSGNKNWNRG